MEGREEWGRRGEGEKEGKRKEQKQCRQIPLIWWKLSAKSPHYLEVSIVGLQARRSYQWSKLTPTSLRSQGAPAGIGVLYGTGTRCTGTVTGRCRYPHYTLALTTQQRNSKFSIHQGTVRVQLYFSTTKSISSCQQRHPDSWVTTSASLGKRALKTSESTRCTGCRWHNESDGPGLIAPRTLLHISLA